MRGYHPKLLHDESKKVVLRPSLHDLPPLDPVDDNTSHLYRLPGRRDTLELAFMRSGSAYSDHHQVPLGNQIMDDMGAVGKRGRKHLECLLDPFKAGFEIRDWRRIVVDKIDREELIQRREILLIGLLVEATHQTFVVFGRHRCTQARFGKSVARQRD